jgi:peroxiredoxin 2/4
MGAPIGGQIMEADAADQSFAVPRMNEPAPEFTARTTHGQRSLGDYRGKWLLFFSHPADFTPVCTSELIAFGKAHPQFQALGCELLALSLDSVFAHLAWLRAIEEKFGVKIPFPIVEDVSMSIAHAYGMIHPEASDTATVRAVFVIDPQGLVRAILHYPMTNGRMVSELYRLVAAMQVTDATGASTPEGWQQGDDMLLAPPQTVDMMNASPSRGVRAVDWYYRLEAAKRTRGERE